MALDWHGFVVGSVRIALCSARVKYIHLSVVLGSAIQSSSGRDLCGAGLELCGNAPPRIVPPMKA